MVYYITEFDNKMSDYAGSQHIYKMSLCQEPAMSCGNRGHAIVEICH